MRGRTGVDDLQAVQPLPELGAESPVCCGLVCEESVAASGWAVKQIQECGAGRLLLVCDVRVPGD